VTASAHAIIRNGGFVVLQRGDGLTDWTSYGFAVDANDPSPLGNSDRMPISYTLDVFIGAPPASSHLLFPVSGGIPDGLRARRKP
jgi:hypothetical protein